MVQMVGLEPTWAGARQILSLFRLPISAHLQICYLKILAYFFIKVKIEMEESLARDQALKTSEISSVLGKAYANTLK